MGVTPHHHHYRLHIGGRPAILGGKAGAEALAAAIPEGLPKAEQIEAAFHACVIVVCGVVEQLAEEGDPVQARVWLTTFEAMLRREIERECPAIRDIVTTVEFLEPGQDLTPILGS